MLFTLKNYATFLYNSNNQHGIHSPFVYRLVTQCLYKKNKDGKSKKERLLLQLINYMQVKSILGITNTKELSFLQNKKVLYTTIKTIENLPKNSSKYDFIFISKTTNLANLETIIPLLHNHSILLIEAIYTSKKRYHYWKKTIKNPNISVSINTYSFGIINCRKEQVKQHFTIRL